jgi:RNA polymerase sigma-70 factor (ECF subfamily)
MDARGRGEVREPSGRLEHPESVGISGLSDAELATLACAGEVEALAALLERYRPSLYAAAIRLLRSRDSALDAVQETCVVALLRIGLLCDPKAVGGWLHTILRNTCLMQLRRGARESPVAQVVVPKLAPGPEDVLDAHAMRDWVWAGLGTLSSEDRLTVMLRYFSRCQDYQAIAAITAVPVGTVRSRLNRAKSQLGTALLQAAEGSGLSQVSLEARRRAEWEHFYAELHESPVPRTYRDTYTDDVDVTDAVGQWSGIEAWAAHEREAIVLGVRAQIISLCASSDLTILEIDFTNPAWAPEHCPPRSTFVHQLAEGRSKRLDIHYV